MSFLLPHINLPLEAHMIPSLALQKRGRTSDFNVIVDHCRSIFFSFEPQLMQLDHIYDVVGGAPCKLYFLFT